MPTHKISRTPSHQFTTHPCHSINPSTYPSTFVPNQTFTYPPLLTHSHPSPTHPSETNPSPTHLSTNCHPFATQPSIPPILPIHPPIHHPIHPLTRRVTNLQTSLPSSASSSTDVHDPPLRHVSSISPPSDDRLR